MFSLLRFFSLSSLALILIAAAALGIFSQQSLRGTLLTHGQDENLAIAGMIGGHLQTSLKDLVRSDPDARALAARMEFDRALRQQLIGRSIVRVMLLDPGQRLIYSTTPGVPQPQFGAQAVRRVLDGRVVSHITQLESFEADGRVLRDVDLVYSLVPMTIEGERVDVVLVVYSDISTLYQRAERNLWEIGGAIILVLLLLYGLLYGVVRYASGELRHHHRSLQDSLKELEAVRRDLELRVEERTRGLAREVEERTAAEEELREQERYLNAVMNNVFNGIITIDQRGIIRSFNPTAEDMFGYRAEDVVGQNVKLLMPDEHARRHDGYISHYLETGERKIIGSLRELEGLDKEGGRFPIELAITEARVGKAPIFIGTIRDLTEQKRAEWELNEARQKFFHQEKMAAIGSLAAGIVHEIGNPIAAISGLLEELCSQCPGLGQRSDEICEGLRLIQEHVQRVIHITRDVSEFANPHGVEPQLLDLNNLIGRTCRLMRHDRRFTGVKLELTLDARLPAFLGVADYLVQVLMNLMANAVDAVAEAGVEAPLIHVRSELGDDRVIIAVSDNGCGMSDEVLEHATEAFYTTKPVGKGTGLGLSLCDSLISAQGGELEIDTEPGRGTEVRILLPVNFSEEMLGG